MDSNRCPWFRQQHGGSGLPFSAYTGLNASIQSDGSFEFMDEIVIRAMAKWPNVPEVYGWLNLDRRGQWSIKTGSHPGSVESPSGSGGSPRGADEAPPRFETVSNRKLIDFIGRNYGHDESGRWYFQNGPQRVYVKLAYTPLVYRIANVHPLSLETHTGIACAGLQSACMDEAGNLLLVTAHGPGLLLDRDLPRALEALTYADGHALEEERLLALIEEGGEAAGVYFNAGADSLPLTLIKSEDVPQRFGYVREPRPAAGQPEC
jgi:hypothetical protein